MHEIFFVRHGRTGGDDFVSAQGYRELELVSLKLEALKFHAHYAVSSPRGRSIQTARFLAYGQEPRVDDRLKPRQGDFAMLREAADEMLAAVTEPYFPPEAKIVVASHDCIPTILAWRLLEERGETVDWNLPTDHRLNLWLDQGEGILVRGTTWQLVTYKEK